MATRKPKAPELTEEEQSSLYEKRLQGMPWPRIAATYEITVPQAVEIYTRISSQCADADRLVAIDTELNRLDLYQLRLFRGIRDGDPNSIAAALAIIDKRQQLLDRREEEQALADTRI